MTPLEAYLRELHQISGLGTKETSGYPALKMLLDAVGKTLNPAVHCIVHPASMGAGIPDVALYTPDQLLRAAEGGVRKAAIPSRANKAPPGA